MENEQNRHWCSMTPLIWSIVPIGTAGLIGLFVLAFPEKGGCFPSSLMDVFRPLFLCCTIPLVALVSVSMGIYSIIKGFAEIREPEASGKTLVVVAIFLGILDIAAGAGFLYYLLIMILSN
ncbi:MAG: hypothetical protein ACYTBX_08145 [Planctomycetota bacterium]